MFYNLKLFGQGLFDPVLALCFFETNLSEIFNEFPWQHSYCKLTLFFCKIFTFAVEYYVCRYSFKPETSFQCKNTVPQLGAEIF